MQLMQKSSKKHNRVEKSIQSFERYSAGPVKTTHTLWIDHKICAMGRFVEKIGSYTQHLQNVISTTVNAKARVTLEGKYAKLVDVNLLLYCTLFIDVLAEVKD